jgi:hypothetical protein
MFRKEIVMFEICRSPLVLGFILALPVATGCATTLPPVIEYSPSFTYSYPTSEAKASDVTIAIVRPVAAGGFANASQMGTLYLQHATAFNSAMAAQFQELLSKKGFKQTGPFDDLNSMTFPDKKGADLALTAQVGITVAIPQEQIRHQDDLFGTRPGVLYSSSGPCTVSGYVSYVLLEPLSGEKLWVKKMDIPTTEVDCSAERGGPGLGTIIANDAAHALEQVFTVVMKKAWDYLSPEEVIMLKKQSQELRAKEVY